MKPLIPLLPLLFLTACGPAPQTREQRIETARIEEAKRRSNARFERAAAGAMVIQGAMRNPDSFTVESALVIGDDAQVVCYQYRSQNGFGGMTRGQSVMTDGVKMVSDGQNGFKGTWNKQCFNKTGEEQGRTVQSALTRMRR